MRLATQTTMRRLRRHGRLVYNEHPPSGGLFLAAVTEAMTRPISPDAADASCISPPTGLLPGPERRSRGRHRKQ